MKENMKTAQEFSFQFDFQCKELTVEERKPKRICRYTVNFLGIKFDNLKMETHFPKATTEKVIADIKRKLEKKSPATSDKL